MYSTEQNNMLTSKYKREKACESGRESTWSECLWVDVRGVVRVNEQKWEYASESVRADGHGCLCMCVSACDGDVLSV